MTKFKKLACLSLMAVMSISLTAGAALAATDSGNRLSSARTEPLSFENVTGKVDLTGVAINNFNSSVFENNTNYTAYNVERTVIVTLSDKCLLDGAPVGVPAAEYLATYSGRQNLRSITDSQDNFLNALSASAVKYTLVDRYTSVLNAVAIKVNTSALSKIRSMAGVQSAVISATYAPVRAEGGSSGVTYNPSNIYGTGIYNSSGYTSSWDGSNVVVAVLDSGFDYTHQAFATMPQSVRFDKDYISSALSANQFHAQTKSYLKGETVTAEDLYINAKVPFAYDYADDDAEVYPSYSNHGTHVAGIISGQAESYTDKEGNLAVDSNGNPVKFTGVAPNVQLVLCKVFTDDLDSKDIGGATTEDIVAALDDCVLLDVDMVNMSLGTVSGFSNFPDSEKDSEGQLLKSVYTRMKQRGISLYAAASNEFSSGSGSAFGTNISSNPDSGTVGAPSTYPGAMSVASINGQYSEYMKVGDNAVYFQNSSDENSVEFDFLAKMLGNKSSDVFKYVIIPGVGRSSDYTSSIQRRLDDKTLNGNPVKVIAVVKRGTLSFKDKVEIAKEKGADAIIVYNNVAGTVRMSLGDMLDPIPAVSVTLDAGNILNAAASNGVGTLTLDTSYLAGPFMNDYSSWGVTPDLKLKPDVTAHGGEITSAVPGGWGEMSGTSMATPNMTGFAALLRSKLKAENPQYDNVQLTRLVNQIVMSTATTVYDQNGLPYSPRKQGSGLATLDNAFNTKAYLYTLEAEENGAEDNRPKIELGEDESKSGEYTVTFHVQNTGTTALTFTPQSVLMTESLSVDGIAVAERAHLFTDNKAQWTVNGAALADGATISVAAGTNVKISVKFTLSSAEKNYIDTNFANGMFVEGFVTLVSATEGQCNLNLPFVGFYGDWDKAPLLDYDCFEISDSEQDASILEDEKLHPQVWATQAYATYYNEKYTVPLGSYVYVQDEDADPDKKLYTEEEYAAISCYNYYYGPDNNSNYLTTTSIKALYAGLLRNAEVVTYRLTDAITGEVLKEDEVYRVGKAYSGGGRGVPAQVLLEMYPEDLGLVANGKYALDFTFYRKQTDMESGANGDNTFSMVFYVDYEAPVLINSSIRYYDYKENNKDKQRIYLDLEIYDNHYAQSVILCYPKQVKGETQLIMATEYVTPVLNPKRNGTTVVSIDVTEFYDRFDGIMYVQIDDYALNHSVYSLALNQANTSKLPSDFSLVDDGRLAVGNDGNGTLKLNPNEAYKVSLSYEGEANISNYVWTATPSTVVKVKNGEIFAVREGKAYVTVTGKDGNSHRITVTVEGSAKSLPAPSFSFGIIENSDRGLVKAQSSVKVNSAQKIQLDIVSDPWYYTLPADATISWASSRPEYATVDDSGLVTAAELDKRGIVQISATITSGNTQLGYVSVTFIVQEAFTLSGTTVIAYHGFGGDVKMPDNKNILTIGEGAFKDNDNIVSITIPKTVTQIEERAFKDCTALENVYFISKQKLPIADADLTLIYKDAFSGCVNLKLLDFSNCKTFTIAQNACADCKNLAEIRGITNIGTMYDSAFENCVSLTSLDLTNLRVSGKNVFAGCTGVSEVSTAFYTAIGEYMFSGCTALTSIKIECPTVREGAFSGCTALTSVQFTLSLSTGKSSFVIGDNAFSGCSQLTEVDFGSGNVSSIGNGAFSGCKKLSSLALPQGVEIGDRAFENSPVTVTIAGYTTTDGYGAIYNGNTLVRVPQVITANFAINAATTAIAAYAFTDSRLEEGVSTIIIPAGVTSIGAGAFAHLNLKTVFLPQLEEIADSAFYGCTSLESIVIPATVRCIQNSAFEGCTSLASIDFEEGALAKIGDSAFKGCTSLVTIALPDGASTLGNSIFECCTALENAILPSVTSMGMFNFVGCTLLGSVVYGADSSVTGDYTFYAGAGQDGNVNSSSLTSVTLGTKTKQIGEGAFEGCTSLESIDLTGVDIVGILSFAFCDNLKEVKGLEAVKYFYAGAFAYCPQLDVLNLSGAILLGDSAFYMAKGSSLTAPKIQYIGEYAFFGTQLTEVNLPKNIFYIGNAAFANCELLTAINIDSKNTAYFSSDGVLYRYVADDSYELIAYPGALSAMLKEQVRTYEVIQGTVSIAPFAFSQLKNGSVKRVILPYTLKAIGDGAFYKSGIATYVFNSINAPTLMSAFRSFGIDAFYSLYNVNFEDSLIIHTAIAPSDTAAYLYMYCPSNGIGYDNYQYRSYFASRATLGELPEDETRALKENIQSMPDANEVKDWLNLTVNDSNKENVEAFSERVKNAHISLNNIKSSVQLEYLGEENVSKLYAIESQLKAVKQKFGIAFTVRSMGVTEGTGYKSEYTAGEKFDLSSVTLTVYYDDYSEEAADMSQITLKAGYDGELNEEMGYVVIVGYGSEIELKITVKPDENQPQEDNPPQEKGCRSLAGIEGVAAMLAAAAFVFITTVKRKKIK